ncbi:MAG: NADP-dependent phosphogluconate dehydrogenase [Pseudomonadota bacterium]|jgi:6-phosphogluconate dehydrogenase|nr:NADP-dependent phosphogluconate dehydrogenase [Pseudomonadota bacterium]
MSTRKARIGLVGLGVMGANLSLNIADNGFDIAVYNRSTDKVDDFVADAGALADRVIGCKSPEELAASLQSPRAIILMVKAGEAVDKTIETLLPHLDEGDMIIDAGNADFNDTRRREADLSAKGFAFIGMGVSGGEEGARHGPSIMVGGPEGHYAVIQDVIEAIAADYQGTPCAAHLGPDGAGHFVKTVHNGIEYADMQLIAEVYGCLRDTMTPSEIGQVFAEWNDGPLNGYLVEITAKVLGATDTGTDQPMVDVIVDAAGQKGTGRWTVIEALKLGQSPSTIEAAVAARSWSAQRDARAHAQDLFGAATMDTPPSLSDLHDALLAARILAYGQGMTLLNAASDEFGWDLDLARVAEIWRAGCIIRSTLLDDIAAAFRGETPHGQLAFAPAFVTRLQNTVPALRRVVGAGTAAGVAMPAMANALAWFDTMRHARGTANVIQAQRDFFGAHGFERLDRDGTGFHGDWPA